MNRRCDLCEWHRKFDEGVGLCYRYPPSFQGDDLCSDPEGDLLCKVFDSSFCGEFTPKGEPVTRKEYRLAGELYGMIQEAIPDSSGQLSMRASADTGGILFLWGSAVAFHVNREVLGDVYRLEWLAASAVEHIKRIM